MARKRRKARGPCKCSNRKNPSRVGRAGRRCRDKHGRFAPTPKKCAGKRRR